MDNRLADGAPACLPSWSTMRPNRGLVRESTSEGAGSPVRVPKAKSVPTASVMLIYSPSGSNSAMAIQLVDRQGVWYRGAQQQGIRTGAIIGRR